MKILEKDFKIDIDEEKCVLFTLKSKKEIKEDDTETYKICSYSSSIKGILSSVIKFRESKKYPFKESSKPIKILLSQHKQALESINLLMKSIEEPIFHLKNKIFNVDK